MHLLNSKLRTLEKRITILYDDKNLLGVYELVSLGRLVCVGGVHSAVDLLHLEQDGHGYTSPLLGRGVDHLHVPDTVFTDHDGYLTPVGSEGNPPDTFSFKVRPLTGLISALFLATSTDVTSGQTLLSMFSSSFSPEYSDVKTRTTLPS